MNTGVMFSSKSMNWATPQDFFDKLNSEFHLPLIRAQTVKTINALHITQSAKMVLHSAGGGQTVFCNPPYGRAIKDWVKKCSEESLKPNTTVVMLIPARTDTSYFHDYIYQKPNVEIRFIRGRLKFGDRKNSAPFPSMVVIFKSKKDGT